MGDEFQSAPYCQGWGTAARGSTRGRGERFAQVAADVRLR
jgi:hypothetical protein